MAQGARARGRSATRSSHGSHGASHRARRRTPTLRRTTAYAALFTAVPVLLGISVQARDVEDATAATRAVGARVAPSPSDITSAPRVVPGTVLAPLRDPRRGERARRAVRAEQRVLADLGTIPGRAVLAYRAAARSAPCAIDWTLIAAIGLVETDHGRHGGSGIAPSGRVTPAIIGPALTGAGGFALIHDTDGGRIDGDRVHDRAVGPMQFIPGTWAWAAADGDGDGRRDPHDIDDAAAATAGYLCRSGDLGAADRRRAAVLTYNQSGAYADAVLSVAAAYATGDYRAVAVVAAEPADEAKPAKRKRTKRARPTPTRAVPSARPAPRASSTPEPKPKPKPKPKPGPKPKPRPEPSPRPSPTPPPTPGPSPSPSPSAGATAGASTWTPSPSPEG